jgi:amino acid permease
MDNQTPAPNQPSKPKGLIILGIILGFVFCYIGYIYMSHTAGNLPAFFPGHSAGSTVLHYKHSIAAFIVGIACFIFAWFKTGPMEV